MEGIKNLVIDFGGVIINLTRNRCIEAFESLGVANIREQIVNNYQHKDLFMKIELGSITVAEFREGIRHLTRQPLTDEQIDAAWIAMLDDVPDYGSFARPPQALQYDVAQQYERDSLGLVGKDLFFL